MCDFESNPVGTMKELESLREEVRELEAHSHRLKEFVCYVMTEWFQYYPEMIKEADVLELKEKARLSVIVPLTKESEG